jgi:hypothetical protein
LGDEAPWSPPQGPTPARQLAAWQKRKAKLQDALAQIERRQQESAGKKPVKPIASTTDPSSRSMKDKEGRVKPNYNVQLVVDDQASMIVAAEVNDAADDHGQLVPMLDEVIEQCGRAPAAVSADSGYNTGAALAELERREIRAYLPDAGTRSDAAEAADAEREAVQAARAGEVLTEAQWSALPKDSAGHIDKTAFRYDPASDSYRCPAGERLVFIRTSQDRQQSGVVLRRQYGFAANSPCALCAHATACCRVPERGRTVNRDQYEERRERLRVRMASEEGKARYKRRRETVEPRFGYIKQTLGVRRFLHRGLQKVRTEWSMLCTAVNIGVLLREWRKVEVVI